MSKGTVARRSLGLDIRKVKSPHDMARALDLHRSGQLDEAREVYVQLVQRHGDHPEAKYGLALLCHAINENAHAVNLLTQVLMKRPKFTAAWYNRGVAYQAMGEVAAARDDYVHALSLEPSFVSARSNLGNALLAMGDTEGALREYERAIASAPHEAEARFNRAHALILTGRWEEGWKEYEQRWNMPGFTAHNYRPPNLPKWEGESLTGKTLVVLAEQGLGDTIMCLRYHEELFTRYPGLDAVRWHIQKPLVRLWNEALHVPEAFAHWASDEKTPMPEGDYWITTMSLPHLLGTTPESVPYREGYIGSDSTLARGGRVGIAWAGSPGHLNDANRSIPWFTFRELLTVNGVEFVSLQVGPKGEDALGDGLLPPYVRDFADTADLLATLDLVISVDTSVVHLAGAMGVPVWTLVAAVPDNRWLLGRTDTPWYDSMTLYRQPIAGDWATVIANVKHGLTNLIRRAA
jgi:tetratricopeptide (TPR) repeat protein